MDPYLIGRTPKEQIQDGMMTINTLSMPFRAMDAGIIALCKSTDSTKKACQSTGELVQSLINSIPEPVKAPIRNVLSHIHQKNEKLPEQFQKEFGIPEEETTYFLQSAAILVESSASSAIGGLVGLGSSVAGSLAGRVANITLSGTRKILSKIPTKEIKHHHGKRLFFGEPGKEGSLEILYQIQANRTLAVYVEWLGAVTRNPRTGNIIAVFASDSTKTSGVIFRAMRIFKQMAYVADAKTLKIQFFPSNYELFETLRKMKNLEYLGSLPSLFPMKGRGSEYPVFKINIPHPTPKKILSPLLTKSGLILGPIIQRISSFSPFDSSQVRFGEVSTNNLLLMKMNMSIFDSSIGGRLKYGRPLATVQKNPKTLSAIASEIDHLLEETWIKVNSYEQKQEEKSFPCDSKQDTNEDNPANSKSQSDPNENDEIKIGVSCPVDVKATHIKNTVISPTLSLNQINASVNISPGHKDRNTAGINVTGYTGHSCIQQVNTGVVVNPLNPKEPTIISSAFVKSTQTGVIISPNNLKNTKGILSGEIGNVKVDMQVDPRRVLNSQVSVKVPVSAYGIPVVIGVHGVLKDPVNYKVTLEVPTGYLNKATSFLGINVPKSIPVASLSVKKIKRIFVRRKKKKNHKTRLNFIIQSHEEKIAKEREFAIQALKASITSLEKDVISSTASTAILKKMTAESSQMVTELTQNVNSFHDITQGVLETITKINQAPSLTETTSKLHRDVQNLQNLSLSSSVISDISTSMQQNSDNLTTTLKKKLPPGLAARMLSEWQN